MSLSISGKTAIVTGAAHGIGNAIARHFLDRGANVMFADIDEAKLEADLGEAGVEVGQDVDGLRHLGERIAARVKRVAGEGHGRSPENG